MVVNYSGIVSVPTLRTAWAENIANAWLPYTNIWETLYGAYLLSKSENQNSPRTEF